MRERDRDVHREKINENSCEAFSIVCRARLLAVVITGAKATAYTGHVIHQVPGFGPGMFSKSPCVEGVVLNLSYWKVLQSRRGGTEWKVFRSLGDCGTPVSREISSFALLRASAMT